MPALLLARSRPYRRSVLSKIKGVLRKRGARGREALVEALGVALDAVTARDTLGLLERCGYRRSVQPLRKLLYDAGRIVALYQLES